MRKIMIIAAGIMLYSGVNPVFAQSIRKSFREMGPMEKTDYNDALSQFFNFGANSSTFAPPTGTSYLSDYAIMHWENGNYYNMAPTSIHMSLYFLPFHRTFLLDWEQRLKSFNNIPTGRSYSYLAVPYWDWREDAGSSTAAMTSSNNPSLWAYSFIPASNFGSWTFNYNSGLYVPGSPQTVGFTRPATFPSALVLNSMAGPTQVNSVMGSAYFYDYSNMGVGFSSMLEMGPHNGVHTFIGGTMSDFYSPLDPVFWLHHAMVDKVWNDWEENFTASYGSSDLQSLPFTASWMGMPGTYFPATLPVYTSELCANKVDNRYLKFKGQSYDVWYAYQGKVLLNGNKSTTFIVPSGASRIYRYTVFNTASSLYDQGEMYIGDVRLTGSTVSNDNKGGFEVSSGATCDFRAPGVIDFRPGFRADAGSKVSARIINSPNGF